MLNSHGYNQKTKDNCTVSDTKYTNLKCHNIVDLTPVLINHHLEGGGGGGSIYGQ